MARPSTRALCSLGEKFVGGYFSSDPVEQSRQLSSHLSHSSHLRSSAGVYTKLRSIASARSHQGACQLGVASALTTHGDLYLADHCTQGQQPRRSCAPSEEGFSGAPEAPCITHHLCDATRDAQAHSDTAGLSFVTRQRFFIYVIVRHTPSCNPTLCC